MDPHFLSCTTNPFSAPPRPWQVWMVGPPGGWVSPGGGEVQWLATAQALKARGLEVQLFGLLPRSDNSRSLSISSTSATRQAGRVVRKPGDGTSLGNIENLRTGAESGRPFSRALEPNPPGRPDILHLFGSHPTHQEWIRWARRGSVPVVLSPIGWFSLAGYWQGGKTWSQKLLHCAKFLLRALCPVLPSWRRKLYRSVDLLLPNSLAEARQLRRYFSIPPCRIHVVPNGADVRFAQATADLFVQRTGLKGFVFCPGRLEPRKNQLGLLRAMRGWTGPIVLMGDPVRGQEEYAEACRREAGTNVHFFPRLAPDDPLLASAYAACGCLVLASWFETPGLVALEAAMQGVPLVLPDVASCREYFGDWALYVRPSDGKDIRRAVEKALQLGRNPRLAEHVRGRYTWDHAAEATLQAYRLLWSPEAFMLGPSALPPEERLGTSIPLESVGRT